MEINWEAIGDMLVASIIKDDEFKKFCDEEAGAFEDRLRDRLEEKFVSPLRNKHFRFANDEDDDEFEFAMNMTYGLLHAFNKYYVNEYLGMGVKK